MNTVPWHERIPKPVAAVPPPEPTAAPIPAQQIPDNGKRSNMNFANFVLAAVVSLVAATAWKWGYPASAIWLLGTNILAALYRVEDEK